MKHRKVSVILAILATVAMAVLVMAQTTAPAGQSDPDSAQTITQSDPPAQAEHSSKKSSEKTPSGSEMPHTASPLALIGLLGVGSIGAGLAAHGFSKRHKEA
jgi:hypothetical protein